jgi:menaquinol-cytochrome c reductase iron-sulfur subunit
MERRDFLARAVKTGGAVVAGIVLVPAAVTTLSPLWEKRRQGTWARVGELESFAPGHVHHAIVEVPRDDWAHALRKRGVFVWRPTPEEVVVYSRSCTDLGCPVTWDPGNGWFFCPCHGGIFDREGVPQKGPPKKPLHRYTHRVEAGRLEIDLDSIPPSA